MSEPSELDPADWIRRLELTDPRRLAGGALSLVLDCRRRGERVILKLSGDDLRREAAALEAWGGRGACRLLWADPGGEALLLAPVEPGTPATAGDDAADAGRAARLLAVLHAAPAPPAIPDASAELDWRFARAHQLLDRQGIALDLVTHAQIDAAHADADALHATREATVLLHGDFLGKNLLLDAAGSWVAIDPRPCRGDPHLDGAFWALTHRHGPGYRQRCLELATAAGGLDAERMIAWARVFAVSETALVRSRARACAYASVLGGRTSSASS